MHGVTTKKKIITLHPSSIGLGQTYNIYKWAKFSEQFGKSGDISCVPKASALIKRGPPMRWYLYSHAGICTAMLIPVQPRWYLYSHAICTAMLIPVQPCWYLYSHTDICTAITVVTYRFPSASNNLIFYNCWCRLIFRLFNDESSTVLVMQTTLRC